MDPRTSYRRYRPDQLGAARIICQLRSVDLPVEDVKSVLSAGDVDDVRDVLLRHQGRLADRAQHLGRMIETAHTYLDHGVPPRPLAEPRRVQIMLAAQNEAVLVDFYRNIFGWAFNEDISSFILGTYHTPSFFLITIESRTDGGSSCFGLLVDDVEAGNQRAIDAGATGVSVPADYVWKPRSSVIDDPAGNRIHLTQG